MAFKISLDRLEGLTLFFTKHKIILVPSFFCRLYTMVQNTIHLFLRRMELIFQTRGAVFTALLYGN